MTNQNNFKSMTIWFNHQRCKPDNETLENYLKTIMSIKDRFTVELIKDYDYWVIYTLNTEKISVPGTELEASNMISYHAPLWHDKMFNRFIDEKGQHIPRHILEKVKSFFETLMYKEKLVGCIDFYFDTDEVETHFDILDDDNIKAKDVDVFNLALDLSEKLKDLN